MKILSRQLKSYEEHMLEVKELVYLASNLVTWPTFEMAHEMHWQLGF